MLKSQAQWPMLERKRKDELKDWLANESNVTDSAQLKKKSNKPQGEEKVRKMPNIHLWPPDAWATHVHAHTHAHKHTHKKSMHQSTKKYRGRDSDGRGTSAEFRANCPVSVSKQT